MKRLLLIGCMAAGLCSCSGAADGDAKTDTTAMPPDTNMNKTEVNHLNTSEGTTTEHPQKPGDSTFSQ